jgi:hypothetical protein
MKKNTAKAQVLLNHLKESPTFHSNLISIKLLYPTDSFRRRIGSVSNLYKILTNGKNTLMGLGTNRDWWGRHNCQDGIYFYEYKLNNIEIMFFFSSEKKINQLELKSRINKILKPTFMEVITDDTSVFSNYFNENSVLESGFQFFGNSHHRGEINVSPTFTISILESPEIANSI